MTAQFDYGSIFLQDRFTMWLELRYDLRQSNGSCGSLQASRRGHERYSGEDKAPEESYSAILYEYLEQA